LNSSQQVKDDGIVIVGLGISPANKEMLQKIVSSQDQVVIFPPFKPSSAIKEDMTSEVTAMLCEGIFTKYTRYYSHTDWLVGVFS